MPLCKVYQVEFQTIIKILLKSSLMDRIKRISALLDGWNRLFVHQRVREDLEDGLCISLICYVILIGIDETSAFNPLDRAQYKKRLGLLIRNGFDE